MAAPPQVRLLYFAWLREKLGTGEETIGLPPEVTRVADLVAWLRQRGPAYEAAFALPATIRCAVNQEFAVPADVVKSGDEIAFFPPITGG